MKKFLVAAFALLATIAIYADQYAIKLTSPENNSVVALTTPEQQEFFLLPVAERRKLYTDQATRIKWGKTGSVPQGVTFKWESELPEGEELILQLCDQKGKEKLIPVKGNSHTVLNLETGKSYTWQLRGRSANGIIACSDIFQFTTDGKFPRLISSPEVGNIRDLGNMSTSSGKKIRQGMIYRGRALNDISPDRKAIPGKSRVTEAGLEALHALGIKSDLELRSDGETAGMTVSGLGADVKWCRSHGMDSYENILISTQKKHIGSIIKFLLNENDYPFYIHCDGGRDRTGMICFLVEGALGVSDEDMERDWQTSALFFTDLKQESFDKFIAAMHKNYGDGSYSDMAKAYLREIGFTENDFAKLRSILLEK